ncbi:MAG: DUF3362 domain-containing protein [Firmicutes bacterium]|nr:DUF3362 domain-containing protein [Bacillota bacterium]
MLDLCRYHVGGQLKIAPEHVVGKVTRLMHKPVKADYMRFIELFKQVNQELGKDQYIVPYFISAHPGCDLPATVELAEFVRDQLQYYPEQMQNFTPTPMTVSTCMYHTGLNPEDGKPVYVPREEKERWQQRALLQYRNRANQKLAREALVACGREDLIGSTPKALVRGGTVPAASPAAVVPVAANKTKRPAPRRSKKKK